MTTIECAAVHPFERAGLGKAPFRLVGVETRRGPIRALVNGVECEIGAPGQPMGCCDYCGTGIAECYSIRSADGRHFVVGCDCVRKTGDARLVSVVEREARQRRSQRQKELDGARIAAMRSRFDAGEFDAKLATLPNPSHPDKSWSGTALDWARWMMRNAGQSGRLRVVRYLERLAAEGGAP